MTIMLHLLLAAGASLWHWAVALTVLVLFLTYAFAAFATKEKLDG